MMKIAYCAGHDLSTPGKRVPAPLDEAETREWVLNDRIADAFAAAAAAYPDIELLRTDDPLGITTIPIAQRVAKANAWGADLYIDMHHNAGIQLGKGGGLTVFSYPGSQAGAAYRDKLYEALIAAGAPKGNRSDPLREKKFLSLSKTKMPAVLIEYAFMDSPSDWEAICAGDFAQRMGRATLEAVAGERFLAEVFARCRVELPALGAEENRRHPVVETVQKRLYRLGYTQVGKADGIAGAKFSAAVEAFQKDQGYPATGVLSGDSWLRLLEVQK